MVIVSRVYALAHNTQHTMHNWSCYESCAGLLVCATEDTVEHPVQHVEFALRKHKFLNSEMIDFRGSIKNYLRCKYI